MFGELFSHFCPPHPPSPRSFEKPISCRNVPRHMRASSRRGSKQSQEKNETRFLWVLFNFNFALNWCINSSTMRLMPKHWTSSAGRKCRCWACSNVTSSESSRLQPKRNEKLFKTFKREKILSCGWDYLFILLPPTSSLPTPTLPQSTFGM